MGPAPESAIALKEGGSASPAGRPVLTLVVSRSARVSKNPDPAKARRKAVAKLTADMGKFQGLSHRGTGADLEIVAIFKSAKKLFAVNQAELEKAIKILAVEPEVSYGRVFNSAVAAILHLGLANQAAAHQCLHARELPNSGGIKHPPKSLVSAPIDEKTLARHVSGSIPEAWFASVYKRFGKNATIALRIYDTNAPVKNVLLSGLAENKTIAALTRGAVKQPSAGENEPRTSMAAAQPPGMGRQPGSALIP